MPNAVLAEICPNADGLGLDYHRNPEERIRHVKEFEASAQRNLFKEFLEELSVDELQDLQGIAFYGRGSTKSSLRPSKKPRRWCKTLLTLGIRCCFSPQAITWKMGLRN